MLLAAAIFTLHVHYMVRDSNGGWPIIWAHTLAALTVPAQLNSPAGQIRQITCVRREAELESCFIHKMYSQNT